jgi:hypothetical protein
MIHFPGASVSLDSTLKMRNLAPHLRVTVKFEKQGFKEELQREPLNADSWAPCARDSDSVQESAMTFRSMLEATGKTLLSRILASLLAIESGMGLQLSMHP